MAVLGAVSAQQWGGQGQGQGQGHGGYRQPIVPAPLAHDGRVIDTPEIVQAKSAHFAAHQQAINRIPQRQSYAPQSDYVQNGQNGQYNDNGRYNEQQNYNENRYSDNNDRYNDNNDRFEDKYDDSQNQVEKRWRGPFAKIEFTKDGKFIKETPEVRHAREQHLAAISAAQKNSNSVGYEGEVNQGQYNRDYQNEGQYNQNAQYNNQNRNYQGNQGNQGGRNFQEDDGQYKGENAYQQNNQNYGRQQNYY